MYHPTQYEWKHPTFEHAMPYDQHHYQQSMDLLDGYQQQNAQYMQPNDELIYSQQQNLYQDHLNAYDMGQFEAR